MLKCFEYTIEFEKTPAVAVDSSTVVSERESEQYACHLTHSAMSIYPRVQHTREGGEREEGVKKKGRKTLVTREKPVKWGKKEEKKKNSSST